MQSVVCLLGFVAAGALFAVLVSSGMWPEYSADPRLRRAVHAVLTTRASRHRQAFARTPGGTAVLPVRPRFERARAIALAVEFASLRGRMLARMAMARQPAELERARGEARLVSVFERERLADFLKVESSRAEVVACALGWPQAGFPSDGSALCRMAVQAAFDTPAGADRAKRALAKHAQLGPDQAETVLAMRGVMELLEGRPGAEVGLRAVCRRYPGVEELIRSGLGTARGELEDDAPSSYTP
jgi:hypothetical protein